MTAKAAACGADLPKWHPKNIHEAGLTVPITRVY